MKERLITISFALLLVGCVTVDIPPEKAAWAEVVRREIAAANETNYVYVAVADAQEVKLVERLAFQHGKETQRMGGTNRNSVCVFRFNRDYYIH